MFDKKDELRDRVNARKHELMSKLDDLEADTRHDVASARDRLKKELDELEATIKDGFDKMSDAARTKLNAWLAKDKEAPKGR